MYKCRPWDCSARISEVLACKTLVFFNEPLYPNIINKYLVDQHTCVFFKNDLSDLISKIKFYLQNQDEYDRIICNAQAMFDKMLSPIEYSNMLLQHAII